MNYILGLDVSTSVLGWCLICKNGENGEELRLGHIDFSKCDGFWEKVDHARAELKKVIDTYKPVQAYVEEPMMGFKQGMSSMTTIATLLRFNGLVSYFVREYAGYDPTMISVNTARKTCGMKIERTSKCGKSGKEQAFQWCVSGPLKHLEPSFDRTKSGKYKPHVYDRADAYVIAYAGLALSTSTNT